MLNENKKWWAMAVDAIAHELGVDPGKGLSEAEATARLQECGFNALGPSPSLEEYRGADKTDYEKGRVLREGKVRTIYLAELVPGDIIIFSDDRNLAEDQKEKFQALLAQGKPLPFIGEMIGADARLLESSNLSTSETVLTGMVDNVKKDASIGTLPGDTPLGERSNMVLGLTSIATGRGRAIVVNTGNKTEVGKIAVPFGL